MQYRRLGRSGLRLSALSLGSWVTFGTQVDVALARRLLETARDAGINFFDNAEAYAGGESERIMGQAIEDLGWSRDSFCVSSKVFFGAGAPQWPTQSGLSRKHVVEACHAALRRLRVDYLDLYFCHRPDPQTPVDEVVRAMHDLVAQGKVLYWGTSEWPAAALRQAFDHAGRHHLTPPTMEQPQYNLLWRHRVEVEYAPLFRHHGLGTTTWSPLRSGILTGKYQNGIPAGTRLELPGYEWLAERYHGERGQREVATVRELSRVAERLDTTMPKLAIAWCLRHPRVSTVILGASRVEQLEENLGALDVVPRLSDAVMAELDAITAPLSMGRLDRVPGGRALAAARQTLSRYVRRAK